MSSNRTKLDAAIALAGSVAPYMRFAFAAITLVEEKRVVSSGHPTFGSDKYWRVYWHPDAVDKWAVPEIAHVLLHELGHLLRGHEDRRVRYCAHPQKWNIAGDCEIESISWPAPVKNPPGEWVAPGKYKLPTGMTAEWYYDKLPIKVIELNICCGSGAGNRGEWEQGPPLTGEEKNGEAIRQAVAEAVARHVQEHGRGSVPAGMELWANYRSPIPPARDWRDVVNEWRSTVTRRFGFAGRSGTVRERNGLLIPRWQGGLANIAIVADTSGSMQGWPLKRVLAEIVQICSLSAQVHIAWQDAGDPVWQMNVKRGSKLKPRGGGGTDMRPAIEAAVKLRPDGIIVLTDGDTPWDKPPLGVRSLAAIVRESGSSPPPAGWRYVSINKPESASG